MDCFRYGWKIGNSCLVNCWVLMLACVFAGHSLPAMLFGTSIGFAERFAPNLADRGMFGLIAAFAPSYAIAGII